MSAPAVVLASADAGLIRLVAAAFEEEAVPLQILAEPISARAAAVRSPLGIGLAVDGAELVELGIGVTPRHGGAHRQDPIR